MKLLAIDPGASGGLAWLDDDGHAQCQSMPPTEGDVLDSLRFIAACGHDTAVIEEVGGFAGVGQPGSAMFKFGRGFGFLIGVCMSLGLRVELVRPQKWQSTFSLGTARGCASKTEWKNKLKAEAQRRFPACDVTLKTADALLILEYGRKTLCK